jgi:glyoxylase-like metal-dependent hydrolase (beta-lactamase superfamily II)
VAVTHFHNDHSGGLRSFIAEGASVVTTAGNRSVFEQMAAAPFSDALAKSPKKPSFELVQGKRVFTDGDESVEIYDIGPSPHAKEMLVAYLPKQRILFQGDLFSPPIDERFPVGPAPETTTTFFAKLKSMGLAVDKLVGVHGRVSTVDELALSVNEAGGGGMKAAGNK